MCQMTKNDRQETREVYVYVNYCLEKSGDAMGAVGTEVVDSQCTLEKGSTRGALQDHGAIGRVVLDGKKHRIGHHGIYRCLKHRTREAYLIFEKLGIPGAKEREVATETLCTDPGVSRPSGTPAVTVEPSAELIVAAAYWEIMDDPITSSSAPGTYASIPWVHQALTSYVYGLSS